MDRGEDEEEEDEEDGGLAIESMPWIASRVLGEAGASSLDKGKNHQIIEYNSKYITAYFTEIKANNDKYTV